MEDLPSEAIDDTLSVQKPPGNDTNDPDETVEPSRELSGDDIVNRDEKVDEEPFGSRQREFEESMAAMESQSMLEKLVADQAVNDICQTIFNTSYEKLKVGMDEADVRCLRRFENENLRACIKTCWGSLAPSTREYAVKELGISAPNAAAQGVNADGRDNSLDVEITREEKRQKLLRLKEKNAHLEAKLQRNSSVSIWERLSSFSYGMFKQSVPDPEVSSNDDQEIEIYGRQSSFASARRQQGTLRRRK